jgi:ParB family transcriptional regulator, chromosome partitioning protein
MARKPGLGRGLEALIPSDDVSPGEGGVNFIPITSIRVNPRQPRKNLNEEDLHDLANSIREHGILQPLILTQDEEGSAYTLIAGERRWRAAQLAGLDAVPAIIRQASNQQRLEFALIENIQRSDLAPLEKADAYQQLIEEFNLSHEEIAERVSKNRVTITNTLRLLKLPETVRRALAGNQISEGHARALLSLNSSQSQIAALQTILNHELNVRQTEELVRKLSGERPITRIKLAQSPEKVDLENRLRSHFGTKVTLQHGKKGGKLIIHYFSDEDLDTLVNQILGNQ